MWQTANLNLTLVLLTVVYNSTEGQGPSIKLFAVKLNWGPSHILIFFCCISRFDFQICFIGKHRKS
jgi:hypothetical protein